MELVQLQSDKASLLLPGSGQKVAGAKDQKIVSNCS